MSDQDWEQLKLPDPSSASPAANVQLCHLGQGFVREKVCFREEREDVRARLSDIITPGTSPKAPPPSSPQ